MGLCRCPKRKVTTQFCYEHRVNVCESCMVEDHPNCIVQGYLQWLKDSDYEPVCTLCRKNLVQDECIRLLCYHVFHWRCLDEKLSQLPSTTAPAGYTCPTCGHEAIPRDNVVSPVADVVRGKLQRARWANLGSSSRRTASRQPDNHSHQDSRGLDSSWSSPSPTMNGAQSGYMENAGAHAAVGGAGSNTMSSRSAASAKASLYEDPVISGSNRSFVSTQPLLGNEEEDKYKRKTLMELVHRWFQSKMILGGRRRNDPTRRWAALVLSILIGVLLLVYLMSRVGRSSAELDPMLSPNFNPALRSRDD